MNDNVGLKRPGVFLTAKLAWISTTTIFLKRPVLFAVIAFLNLVIGFVERCTQATIDGYVRIHETAGTWTEAELVFLVVTTAVNSMLLAPVLVVVHRYVLLGEASGWKTERIARFALWSAAISLCVISATLPAFIGAAIIVPFILIGFAVCSIKLICIFPAVAVDVPSKNPVKRITASWKMTDGLFWLILLSLAVSGLPLLIVEFAPQIVSYVFHAVAVAGQGEGVDLPINSSLLQHLSDLIGDILAPFWLGVGAAVVSWIYLWRQENPVGPQPLTERPPES